MGCGTDKAEISGNSVVFNSNSIGRVDGVLTSCCDLELNLTSSAHVVGQVII